MSRALALPVVTVAAAAALAAAALAGCDSTPSCAKAMANAAAIRDLGKLDADHARVRCEQEQWSGTLRECIAGAKTEAALDRCAATSRPREASGSFEAYQQRGKSSEAELNLHRLKRALETHFAEYAEFPAGVAEPSPQAGSCCSGPGHRCAPEPSLWQGALWQSLDVSVDEPAYFSYAYRGGAREATVEAVGDLDCDGDLSTYTLRCDVDAATSAPRCELTRPARPD
jgi:hypothetical protein